MAVNWESAQNGLGYPRFAAIEELFVRVFDSLTSVSHDPLIPIQVEVTYVNHIGSESDLTNHSQAPELFRLAGELPVPLGLADRTQAEASFAIPFGDTAPYGKLHVSLVPGLKDDGQTPIYSLTLTARGKPVTADKEGVLRFVEVGHEAIVRGFASATTERAHQIWGRHE